MNFKLGSQEKFSVSQWLFVNTWWRLWWRLWYRKVAVHGFKHIYTKKPLIITPNHQNAAMDALTLIGVQTRQVVWLARADVFKNKFVRPILRFFKIMPVYRMQDGIESLGNNEKIFEKCVKVLEAHKIIGIFPEATHWGYRRLRAIKKAVPRIAFLAEELSSQDLDVHIMPVGIYYDNYVSFRSHLFVNFGEPFSIAEYVALYKENPNKAIIALRNRIREEMEKCMLHIKHDGERYEAYEELRRMCASFVIKKYKISGRSLFKNFQAYKKVIEQLDTAGEQEPEVIETLEKEVIAYRDKRNAMRYREWLVDQNGGDEFTIIWNSVRLLVGLPIFIIGYIVNIFFFNKTYSIAQKTAEDIQFHNSITFSLGFLIVPIWFSVISIFCVLFWSLSWWMFFVIGVALLIVFVVSFDYFILAKKTFHMLRYKIQDFTDNSELESLRTRRKKIMDICEKIL